MLGTSKAAETLGVTSARVRQLIASGKLPAERLGSRSWAIEDHHLSIYLYALAEARVDNTPSLRRHEDIILADYADMLTHLRWVATAPVAEIVGWAEAGEE